MAKLGNPVTMLRIIWGGGGGGGGGGGDGGKI